MRRIGFSVPAVLVSLFAGGLLLLLFAIRQRGLGMFDGSEYSLHIITGGIAHAPGYPLYLLLGRLLNQLVGDPFLAQQAIGLLSLLAICILLWRTFREEGRAPDVSALAILFLLCSYYIKLYTVVAEVFLSNLALFAALGYALSRWFRRPAAETAFWPGVIYGLGLAHHHTLVLTLPAFLILAMLRGRRDRDGNRSPLGMGYFLVGLAAGCMPLLGLFQTLSEKTPYTYFPVESLSELAFVLFRQAYGTLNLTAHATAPSLEQMGNLLRETSLRNFGGWSVGLLLPALLTARQAKREFRSFPSETYAAVTLAVFLAFFLPAANISLSTASGQNTLIRFLTIPFFLLVYLSPRAFEFLLKSSQELASRLPLRPVTAFVMGLILMAPALSHLRDLDYRFYDPLDEHIAQAYRVIFEDPNPVTQSSEVAAPGYRRCVIFTQADALFFGVQYFNEVRSPGKRCFIYSLANFSGHYASLRDERLEESILGPGYQERLRAEAISTREVALRYFRALMERGYRVFLLNEEDASVFGGGEFGVRLLGNIRELRVLGQEEVEARPFVDAWKDYLNRIEAYLNKTAKRPLPDVLLDERVDGVLFQNLTAYVGISRARERARPGKDPGKAKGRGKGGKSALQEEEALVRRSLDLQGQVLRRRIKSL